MHGILDCTFADYTNQLRENYPERTIRNAAIFASDVPGFARLGYIELFDARTGIPQGFPGWFGPDHQAGKTSADLDYQVRTSLITPGISLSRCGRQCGATR